MLHWDDLRFFLAISRHRTLSAAARHLHVTQSTVGRRMTAMQAALGVRLLQRTPDGFDLTTAGEAILPQAERVEAAAREVEQAVAGQDTRLAGTVRVATSAMVASHLLAGSFAALHDRSASIMVEVIARAPIDPLSRRKADISVQLQRFQHPDLVVRSLGAMQFGLYGSQAYLDKYGSPDLQTGCPGHQMVTLADDMGLPQHTGWMAECVGQAQIVIKSDSYEMQHAATVNGSGLALLPRFRADGEPALRRLDAPVPLPPAEIWLGVHRENRHNPRVRMVLDVIAGAVRARAAELDPNSA